MLNELKNAALIVLSVVCFLFLLRYSCDDANAEPHAIVSFNDAEHLGVLQDSVIGVCDTVDSGEDYIRFNEDGSSYVYNLHTITCRELVCVTVVKDFEPRIVDRRGILLQVGTPGQAIIFYEEVKQ